MKFPPRFIKIFVEYNLIKFFVQKYDFNWRTKTTKKRASVYLLKTGNYSTSSISEINLEIIAQNVKTKTKTYIKSFAKCNCELFSFRFHGKVATTLPSFKIKKRFLLCYTMYFPLPCNSFFFNSSWWQIPHYKKNLKRSRTRRSSNFPPNEFAN